MTRTAGRAVRTARPAPGSWPRFVAALVGLAVAAVGIPAVLVAVGQVTVGSWHPLPGIGTVEEIRAWFGRELTSTEVAAVGLRVLLVAGWVLWLGLLMSVVSAIAASRPSLERIRLPRLAMFEGVAGWIAAGLTALSSLTPNPSAGGVEVAVAAAVVEVADSPTVVIAPRQATLGRVGWERVQHGESIEMFAARTLGSAERWSEVWELNSQRQMDETGARWNEPWRLAPGWELELPTNGPTATDATSPGARRHGIDAATDERSLGEATHVVVSGDNLWTVSARRFAAAGIAATDEMIATYVDRIVAANPEIDDPNLIFPGQRLALPPIDTAPASTAVARSLVDVRLQEPVVHVFVAGDTLWDVLHAYYGHVDADIIWEVAERNGLEDPSDIPVGAAVTIAWPPPEQPAAKPDAPRSERPPPRPAKEPPPPPVIIDDTERQPVPRPPFPTPAPETKAPTVSVPDARPVGPKASVPEVGPPEPEGAELDAERVFETTPRTLWWQIPSGLLLTAGLSSMALRLRRRRMGRLEPGQQLGTPPDVAAGTELAVSAGRPLERLSTLQALLRTITPYAREQADPPAVRAVQVGEDRVEVLFADPAPFPPPGWSTLDGGASWIHRLDGQPAPAVRQLVTPALVTAGRRADGAELLLDLETAGSLAITGDHAAALGLARAIALEVATYPLGVAMDLCTIGFDVDGLEHCDRAWKHTSLARAVRVARETLERTAATEAASLVAARARSDHDEALLDPQIFIVDVAAVAASNGDASLLEELVALCTPQGGAALVLVGDHPEARERIEITAADEARWRGAELRPVILEREAVAQAAVMLDHAANAPVESLTPSPVIADHLGTVQPQRDDDTDDTDDDADGDDGGGFCYTPPDHDVLVQVLGEVTIHGRRVTSAGDVELLALLTLMRHKRPNVDTVTHLLTRRRDRPASDQTSSSRWDDDNPLEPATVLKKVSILRAKLGTGADGADLLPSAKTARGVPGRYLVSPRVITDVDLIDHRYETATRLPSADALVVLRDGLTLFNGPPFRGQRKGYDWAGPEGITAHIHNVVNAYATMLMQLAFDLDDLALVLQTAGAAGRVIEDPTAELPMRDLERHIAEASGDPDLAASVLEARRRLHAYTEDVDPVAGD
jgi:nucleoid-associated protein YgaU